eukprot:6210821-Pleurochrysis_carterae.AAC.4
MGRKLRGRSVWDNKGLSYRIAYFSSVRSQTPWARTGQGGWVRARPALLRAHLVSAAPLARFEGLCQVGERQERRVRKGPDLLEPLGGDVRASL